VGVEPVGGKRSLKLFRSRSWFEKQTICEAMAAGAPPGGAAGPD